MVMIIIELFSANENAVTHCEWAIVVVVNRSIIIKSSDKIRVGQKHFIYSNTMSTMTPMIFFNFKFCKG